MRSPPPHPGGLPLTSQWMRIIALSDCIRWRFSSRKYSPRGFNPVSCTMNAESDVGAAPKLYTLLVVSGASVTQPSSLSDQASIRDGLNPVVKFPLLIRLYSPIPSELPSVL